MIDREVAVKVIDAEYANNPEFIRRFESEAQMIARLEHLNIVPIYDFWREPNGAYLVMRWMRGGNLRSSLAEHGPWPLQAAARLLDQVAAGLTVAHRNQIVHRDLKPDNILLDEDNNAYLADFGIAKDIKLRGHLVEYQDRMGSPGYMAPEQLTDESVSAQTDIYSLGIVLYELLTGLPPFETTDTFNLVDMQVHATLPPLQKYRPELPMALNSIIWRATEKQKEKRYPDVLTLAREFRQLIPGSEITLPAFDLTPTRIQPKGDRTLAVEDVLEPQNPYKGLRAFQEGDAADFFGREEFAEQLVTRLTNDSQPVRFLALVGPSGSGKSSMLRAGLLPLLRRGALDGSQNWYFSQIVPGASPLASVRDALVSIAPDPPENILDQLRQQDDALSSLLNQLLPPDDSEFCLLIDQFEEIFTLVVQESERLRFLNNLYQAVTNPASRIRVLITLRADFYGRPLLYSGFGDLMRTGTEVVLPLQVQELEQAVIGPAQRFYIRFETGLMSRIISDVNERPGSLPLMQYALTELFERRQDRMLTNAAYEAVKGVSGALAQRAEELYQTASPAEQEAVQKMMLHLVMITETGEWTRRRVLQAELLAPPNDPQVQRQVMELFGNSRLLTFDHDAHSRAPTIELAHEALISAWDRLQDWLASNADYLRLQRQLNIAATDWDRSGREPSFLASGTRLAQFETLLNAFMIALNKTETEYLDASLRQKQRSARRLRLFIASLIAALVVVFALMLFAFQQRAAAEASRLEANQQAKVSRSRELAATALTHLNQLDLSLLLGIEALNADTTFEARSSLLTALEAQPDVETFFHDADAVRAVAFSPDGQLLAEAGRTGAITLWSVDTRQRVGTPLVGHTDWINNLAFDASGKLLASASMDGTVRLWNVDTGASVGQPLAANGDQVWALAFSADGVLASAGADGVINLWDVNTGKLTRELKGHSDAVYSLAFSPDGRYLASGSADDSVRLWRVSTGDMLHTFTDHKNWVLSVAFSPDGQLLASSGVDENIVIWDAQTYETKAEFSSGQSNWVRSLAFSPDSQTLASASQDDTIRLWNLATTSLIGSPLTGHFGEVWSIAFRPSSQTSELASGGSDGEVILWNLKANPPLAADRISSTEAVTSLAFAQDHDLVIYGTGNVTTASNANQGIHLWNLSKASEQGVLEGQSGVITDLAYNPVQGKLISSSTDGTLFLWDLASMKAVAAPLVQLDSAILSAAVSPDGQLIATGDERGVIHLWNSVTGASSGQPLLGHEDSILSLAFSPDGRILASGSRDRTVRLWVVNNGSGSALQTLQGHQDVVASVAFSPNGQLLASGSYDGTIRLWDMSTYQPVGQPLTGHKGEVWNVAFSPDSRIVASAGQDGTIRFWDANTHQLLGNPILGHSDWVTRLAFSADGKLLASGSLDSSVFLWDVSLTSWQQHACQIADRNLSTEEWQRYFPDESYRDTCSSVSGEKN